MTAQGVTSQAKSLSITSSLTPRCNPKNQNLFGSSRMLHELKSPYLPFRQSCLCCTKLSQWEPSPVKYAPAEGTGDKLLEKTANVFEFLGSENAQEASTDETEEHAARVNQSSVQLQVLKWPIWLLGPSVLLTTGMAPTLWLPLSSIFLGPNVVSLFSLIGLDSIFNLGATLFLLMADSCARPKNPSQTCKSKPPFSYRFWNILANIVGFTIPLLTLFGSQRGILLLEPQLPFISTAVLFFPYYILLSVQMLTEMLTWHWQSPVWLVTPVVYETYRVLQLMRGLKLSAEIGAPVWVFHTLRGLVSWWVLILGMHLMRVAWFAGFSARVSQKHSSAAA